MSPEVDPHSPQCLSEGSCHTFLLPHCVPQLQLSLPAEWIVATTFAAGTAILGYLAYNKFYIEGHYTKAVVSFQIQKDNPKVEHAFKMKDLGNVAMY